MEFLRGVQDTPVLRLAQWFITSGPPRRANRVRLPVGPLAGIRTWESRRAMPPFGGFSSGISSFPSPSHFTIVGSQDVDFKRHPNLFTPQTLVAMPAAQLSTPSRSQDDAKLPCLYEAEEYPGSKNFSRASEKLEVILNGLHRTKQRGEQGGTFFVSPRHVVPYAEVAYRLISALSARFSVYRIHVMMRAGLENRHSREIYGCIETNSSKVYTQGIVLTRQSFAVTSIYIPAFKILKHSLGADRTRGSVEYPPIYTDITQLDIYPWETLNNTLYTTKPWTLNITNDVLVNACESTRKEIISTFFRAADECMGGCSSVSSDPLKRMQPQHTEGTLQLVPRTPTAHANKMAPLARSMLELHSPISISRSPGNSERFSALSSQSDAGPCPESSAANGRGSATQFRLLILGYCVRRDARVGGVTHGSLPTDGVHNISGLRPRDAMPAPPRNQRRRLSKEHIRQELQLNSGHNHVSHGIKCQWPRGEHSALQRSPQIKGLKALNLHIWVHTQHFFVTLSNSQQMFHPGASVGFDDNVVFTVLLASRQCFAQRKDNLENDVRTGRPRTIRTACKIEEVATLARTNDIMIVCGDFTSSDDDYRVFLNQILIGDKNGCFMYDRGTGKATGVSEEILAALYIEVLESRRSPPLWEARSLAIRSIAAPGQHAPAAYTRGAQSTSLLTEVRVCLPPRKIFNEFRQENTRNRVLRPQARLRSCRRQHSSVLFLVQEVADSAASGTHLGHSAGGTAAGESCTSLAARPNLEPRARPRLLTLARTSVVNSGMFRRYVCVCVCVCVCIPCATEEGLAALQQTPSARRDLLCRHGHPRPASLPASALVHVAVHILPAAFSETHQYFHQ
ncbi:hypothetical protein PR048_013697 [Dryococelus australis]|uniref:Uncharacterized protein n=1 Tax=Dryococelus australis TaxID=614101 RepID=A0ABQ9HTC6_9NEOP|nr:hypothetical protein PR048_013697 [Dryococelus australis]